MKKILIFTMLFVLLLIWARQISSASEKSTSNLGHQLSGLESMMKANTKKSLAGTTLLALTFGTDKIRSEKLKKIIEQLNLWPLFILNPLHLFLLLELIPFVSRKKKNYIHIIFSAILFFWFKQYQFALNFIYSSLVLIFRKLHLEIKNQMTFIITYLFVIAFGIFYRSPFTFAITFGIWGSFLLFKHEPKKFQFLIFSLVLVIIKYFFNNPFSFISILISLFLFFLYRKAYKLLLPLCVFCLMCTQNSFIIKTINILIYLLNWLSDVSKFFSNDNYFSIAIIILICLYTRKFSYIFLLIILNLDLAQAPTVIFSK